MRIDQSYSAVSATVYSDVDKTAAREYARTVHVRASLRQNKEAFAHPIAAKIIGVGPYNRSEDLPQRSLLRSTLDDMKAHIGAAIEDGLREALGG